jgi:sulfate-transporting ATPase
MQRELGLDPLDFRLPPGGIVGVIGPNWARETTPLSHVTGQETPDSATFRVGDTVKLGYCRPVPPYPRRRQYGMAGDLGCRNIASRAYCALFKFRGPDQQKPDQQKKTRPAVGR